MKKNRTKLVDRDTNHLGFSGTIRRYGIITHFLESYPALECLTYQSLHRILIQKDQILRARVIVEILNLIKNPKITDYRVQKIISEQKTIITADKEETND